MRVTVPLRNNGDPISFFRSALDLSCSAGSFLGDWPALLVCKSSLLWYKNVVLQLQEPGSKPRVSALLKVHFTSNILPKEGSYASF